MPTKFELVINTFGFILLHLLTTANGDRRSFWFNFTPAIGGAADATLSWPNKRSGGS
jgi:hypothetical protein